MMHKTLHGTTPKYLRSSFFCVNEKFTSYKESLKQNWPFRTLALIILRDS